MLLSELRLYPIYPLRESVSSTQLELHHLPSARPSLIRISVKQTLNAWQQELSYEEFVCLENISHELDELDGSFIVVIAGGLFL